MQVGRYLGFCVRQIRIFGVLRETYPGYFAFLGRILIDIKKKNFSHDLSRFCFPAFLQFLPGDQIDLSSYMKHVPKRAVVRYRRRKFCMRHTRFYTETHVDVSRRISPKLTCLTPARLTAPLQNSQKNNKKQLCLLLLSRQLLLA